MFVNLFKALHFTATGTPPVARCIKLLLMNQHINQSSWSSCWSFSLYALILHTEHHLTLTLKLNAIFVARTLVCVGLRIFLLIILYLLLLFPVSVFMLYKLLYIIYYLCKSFIIRANLILFLNIHSE